MLLQEGGSFKCIQMNKFGLTQNLRHAAFLGLVSLAIVSCQAGKNRSNDKEEGMDTSNPSSSTSNTSNVGSGTSEVFLPGDMVYINSDLACGVPRYSGEWRLTMGVYENHLLDNNLDAIQQMINRQELVALERGTPFYVTEDDGANRHYLIKHTNAEWYMWVSRVFLTSRSSY